MISDDIKELKEALAKGPTDGEWSAHATTDPMPSGADQCFVQVGERRNCPSYQNGFGVADEQSGVDAVFVELCSPSRIARLVECCEEMADALKFYADCSHFEQDNSEPPECEKQSEAETVSGEPQNYFCGHGDFTFEDGSIASTVIEKWGLG